MGHSMLGPHINWKADQIDWLAKARPRVAKVLLNNVDPDWMREARAASPQTFWVGRFVLNSQPLSPALAVAQAKALCEEILPKAEPFRDTIDALEGYNEVAFTSYEAPYTTGAWEESVEEMKAYEALEQKRCEILHREGWKAVVGNFSTGTPEIELWRWFHGALEAGDYLGLHEYSAPSMKSSDTWLCRRYQRVYEHLPPKLQQIPLIITECGIDGGVIGEPQHGWKRYRGDTDGYMFDLSWYDEALQRDAQRWPIVGATIFCHGHVAPEWETFDIQGDMANVLAEYMAQNPPQPWLQPVDPPAPNGGLLDRLRAAFGDQFDDIRDDLVRDENQAYLNRLDSEINYQVIHHTGNGTTASTYSNVIARYHVSHNGWPAIGYHFLVYPHKVRYVGSLNTERANVWGRNREVIGIALVGDYSETRPSDATLRLCRRLSDTLDAHLGREVPRVGHRDIALEGHGTRCPGDLAYGPNGWLREIQRDSSDTDLQQEVERLRAQVADRDSQIARLWEKIARVRKLLNEASSVLSATDGTAGRSDVEF